MQILIFFLTFNIWCFRIAPLLHIEIRSESTGASMSYLVCDKRKGSPKVHVEVCRRKCKEMNKCKTYKDFDRDNLEKKAA